MAKSFLFSPITIGSHTYKNRVFMSPMCLYICDQEDGVLTQKHLDHYVSRAAGGVGAIVIEATRVCPEGGISSRDLGLYNDEQEAKLKGLVDHIHSYNCKIGVQISHAGRKGLSGFPAVSSSALAFDDSFPQPRALTEAEVASIINSYIEAGVRAARAGCDFVEIHGAHGYLVSQFISPLVNKRTDNYGGSLEKRYRFLGEIIKGLKVALATVNNGKTDIHLRISASEVSEAGNSFDDISQMLLWAKADGVTFFDISSGGITPEPPTIFPGYQALLSRRLKALGLQAGVVGLFNQADLAEYVLRQEDADVIYLGRPLLENPNWAYSAALKLRDKPDFAIDVYYRGFPGAKPKS